MSASFADFHFLRPWWLAALVPLGVLLWRLAHQRLRGGNWEAVCDPALLPFVLMSPSGPRRRWPLSAAALGGLLGVVALAGPVWERLPQPVFRAQSALVVVLDLSRSMDAGDVKPSRLARARFKIADILEQRKEGQTALVVYAGAAFTVTPLTDDTATIGSQLAALSTEIMPTQGSRTSAGLELAARLLQQAGNRTGEILLLCDGDGAGTLDVARRLRDRGYRLSVLGVGTEDGAPIPKPGGGFLSDRSGAIVIPKLDAGSLEELAAAGGGRYAPLSVNDSDLDALLTQANPLQELGEESGFEADVWREQGPWLLLLLLPIGALAFRRGVLVILLLALLPLPERADAVDWTNLWLRQDQQAGRALEDGDTQVAAELFRDPAWKGAASYRAGDYEEAVKALEALDDLTSHYNRGNALARQGSYEEAIAAYDETLERDAGHEDARHNRDLLQQLLDQQQQQQQQNPENQQGDQEKSQGDQSGGNEQNQDQQQPDEQSAQQPSDASEQNDSSDEREQSAESSADQGDEENENQEQAMGEEQREPADQDTQERQASAAESTADESEQAAEQWLRRIPDDPAGLLRRKFRYQYGQRKPASRDDVDEQEW